MDNKILDLFYNKIIKEASLGKVDCFFKMNIIFNTIIDNNKIYTSNEDEYNGIFVPSLKITNHEVFDRLLCEYVNLARDFYPQNNFDFLNDLDLLYQDQENKDMLKEEYLIKYVICTLFANATSYDFENPILFLQNRISMLQNHLLNESEIDFGNLESINAKLKIKEEKCPIKAETPYRIISYLEFPDGYQLLLPEIYAGKTEETSILYGIQKTSISSSQIEEREYLKRIRKGMISKINGAPEHYFLSVMLFLVLSHNMNIEVIPFLIERWNAKRMSLINKAKNKGDINIESITEEQEQIQNNITNIFIRYFTKLEDVTNGLDLSLEPFAVDASLHISLDDNFESRSTLFNELHDKANELENKNGHFK